MSSLKAFHLVVPHGLVEFDLSLSRTWPTCRKLRPTGAAAPASATAAATKLELPTELHESRQCPWCINDGLISITTEKQGLLVLELIAVDPCVPICSYI